MYRYLLIFIVLLFIACESSQKNTDEAAKNLSEDMTAPSPSPYQPTFSADFLMGKFDPSEHPQMIEIDSKYADQKGRIMHKEAYAAFQDMHQAAQSDGIQLIIRSALRNFDYQKSIWERKWTGQTILSGNINATEINDPVERAREILKFSSMPGTSRHHWGTDIDMNSFNNTYFESGRGKKEFDWLQENAANFGFCRSYTEKTDNGRTTGYEEEKWHWSYTPLSKIMLKDAQHLLKDSQISGFLGSETATKLSVVENYILGVNLECK